MLKTKKIDIDYPQKIEFPTPEEYYHHRKEVRKTRRKANIARKDIVYEINALNFSRIRQKFIKMFAKWWYQTEPYWINNQPTPSKFDMINWGDSVFPFRVKVTYRPTLKLHSMLEDNDPFWSWWAELLMKCDKSPLDRIPMMICKTEETPYYVDSLCYFNYREIESMVPRLHPYFIIRTDQHILLATNLRTILDMDPMIWVSVIRKRNGLEPEEEPKEEEIIDEQEEEPELEPGDTEEEEELPSEGGPGGEGSERNPFVLVG